MFFSYVMANRKNGAIYVGQRSDLLARVWEHKQGVGSDFTREHECYRLVWFESHDTRLSAFTRERRLKTWNRDWKISLIVALNPDWDDLSLSISEADIYDPRRMFKAYALDDIA